MADFKLGTIKPTKIYLGTTEVKKLYLGSTEVWSGYDWSSVVDDFINTVNAAPGTYETETFDIYDNMNSTSGYFGLLYVWDDSPVYLMDTFANSSYTALLNDTSGDWDFIDSYNINTIENIENVLNKHGVYLIQRSPDWDDEIIEEGSGYILVYEWMG